MSVEFLGAERFGRGDDDWHIFGLAPGHYGVNGNFLDRYWRVVRCTGANHLLWIAACASQHSDHSFGCRRNYRKSIGQPLLEHELKRIVTFADLDLTGTQTAPVGFSRQSLENPGLD